METNVVSADKETIAKSLVESQTRLEEARAFAVAANEAMYEALINLDPDEVEWDLEDFGQAIAERKRIEKKIEKTQADAEIAWDKYEKALIRHDWETQQARKSGIIIEPL